MSAATPQHPRQKLEAILRAAEERASERASDSGLVTISQAVQSADDRDLLIEASRELHRHAVRRRLLADIVTSDMTWPMLVDLLVRQSRCEDVRASDWELRFGLSEGTATRMVAGLIDAGLVRRVQQQMEGVEADARLLLTDWGHSILRAVFSAYK